MAGAGEKACPLEAEQRTRPLRRLSQGYWRHLYAICGVLWLRSSGRAETGHGRSKDWLERMAGEEALYHGKYWLKQAQLSRDTREAQWAEMLLAKSVADLQISHAEAKLNDNHALAAAFYYLGMTKKLLDKGHEALGALQACAAMRPFDRAVLYHFGAMAEELQDWDIAEDAFRRLGAAAMRMHSTQSTSQGPFLLPTDIAAAAGAAAASLGWVLFRAGKDRCAIEHDTCFSDAPKRETSTCVHARCLSPSSVLLPTQGGTGCLSQRVSFFAL